ncbi:ATP synthase subunit I [Kaistella jeonii]|uniref:ATPase F0F1 n=2 Tax=Kaistella jeonii TaxID=266749 RepID=A0A0C1CX74_9FLAO|nr:ATP synthase subunit I [Kaistella jeonii]KIA86045.1 ATPase F0F1 [Kaistella jeonii]
MNDILTMILVFLEGIILGVIFFGGLWFTVKKSINAKLPALLISSSLFVRIAITMLGFYFVGVGNWQRLLLCLLGFITARFLVLFITKKIDAKNVNLDKIKINGTQS